MSSKTILIGLGIFGLVGKNLSREDLPGSSLLKTVVHKTLKILPLGVNLCQSNAAFNNDSIGECGLVRFTTQFFILGKGKALPIRIGSQTA